MGGKQKARYNFIKRSSRWFEPEESHKIICIRQEKKTLLLELFNCAKLLWLANRTDLSVRETNGTRDKIKGIKSKDQAT